MPKKKPPISWRPNPEAKAALERLMAAKPDMSRSAIINEAVIALGKNAAILEMFALSEDARRAAQKFMGLSDAQIRRELARKP